ncbi:MFS transporter [Sphaerisporangium flaviroseum]|uniref:MFS transporter n=1 Tax=Sphaerisporangium flaviroseum TaxID=509199 RepID=A0ABP7IDY4_9ACTN
MSEPAQQVADAPRPPLPARGLLAPLRHRDFRWLVSGQMLSTFGDMAFLVALPFIVLRDGDAGDLALILTMLGVGRVVGSPIGGMLSDRWSPRSVMLVSDLARAAVLAGLIALIGSGGQGLLWLGIGVAVLGALEGLFLPAYWAVMPALLPEEELASGNAVSEAVIVVAVVAGPLVGGIAMASTAPAAVLAVNALTFLISAGTLLKMSGRRERALGAPGTTEPEPRGGGQDDARSGFWSFARGSRLFQAILMMAGALQLTSAGLVSVALPVFVDQEFSDGRQVFGLLLSAHGAGLLAGTLAAGPAWKVSRPGYLAVGLVVLDGLALLALTRLPGLAALMISTAVLGLVAGALSIIALTLLQRIAPPAVRGRVMAAFTSVTIAAFPISAAVIGLIVTGLGVEAAFVAGGLGVLVVSVIGITQRAVREA